MSKADSERDGPGGRGRQREVRFVVLFAVLLTVSFTFIAWNPVNDRVIEPLTAAIAKLSGRLLILLGQEVHLEETQIVGPRFAVNIRNGCNGVETLLIFGSAVLAFPAPWRSRLVGLLLGALTIQALNLVRVVALFLTGTYLPSYFDHSHTVIWQSIVVLSGVLLWIYWATLSGRAPRRAPSEN